RRRVDSAELEDVPDLDRRLEPQRAAATRTGVTLAREADVRESSVEVPPVLHAAQVVAGAVRAGDELPGPERLVEHDGAIELDRPERAGVRAECRPDLVDVGRPDIRPEDCGELAFVEAVVASHECEDDLPVGHYRHRLRRRGDVDAE